MDSVLYKKEGRLATLAHFKETDRNRYIPTASCHHPKWIKAILKGQLMRLRRNCDNDDDFEIKDNMIMDSFREKGNENRLEIKLRV